MRSRGCPAHTAIDGRQIGKSSTSDESDLMSQIFALVQRLQSGNSLVCFVDSEKEHLNFRESGGR